MSDPQLMKKLEQIEQKWQNLSGQTVAASSRPKIVQMSSEVVDSNPYRLNF